MPSHTEPMISQINAQQSENLARHDQRLRHLEDWQVRTDERINSMALSMQSMETTMKHAIKVAFIVLGAVVVTLVRDWFTFLSR